MGTIGTSGELQDDRTVNQPVKKCRRQRRIAQVIAPVLEVDIGRQRRRTSPRASVEQAIIRIAGL